MAKGLCPAHYTQWRTGVELRPQGQPRGVCIFDGCDKLWGARQLCDGHYDQWRRGRELRPLRQLHTGLVRNEAPVWRAKS